MRKALSAAFTGLFVVSCATPAPYRANIDPIFDLMPSAEVIESALAQNDTTGLAIVPVRNCEVLPARFFGVASRSDQQSFSDNSVFEAASISKSVFAFLVMKLTEEGVIDLDRPIAADMQYSRISDRESFETITPRMILSHRTGLPNWAGDPEDGSFEPLQFQSVPGTTFSYSGEAYQILQALVERSTGDPLETTFRRILGPAMPDSSFESSRAPSEPVMGYYRPNGDLTEKMAAPKPFAQAAGGLITTPADLANFVAILCRRQILSENTYREMWSINTQLPLSDADHNNRITDHGLGLGYQIETVAGHRLISHSGNNQNFQGYFMLDLTSNDGIVYLSNDSTGLQTIASVYGLYEKSEEQR